MKKPHQQRRRTQAEKDAATAAFMASAEAVLGPPTKNLHEVLGRIIDENPDADSSVIGAKLWHIAKNDPDLMRAIVDDVLKDFRRSQAN